MMRGIQAAAQGRIGNEPEQKFSAAGKQYIRFNMATDKYAREGEKAETQWVTVMYFGGEQDLLMGDIHKGVEVYAEGSLNVGEYTVREEHRISVTIMAFFVQPIAAFKRPGSEKGPPQQRDETGAYRETTQRKEPKRDDEIPEDQIPF
jgi:single-stranded DNA-binding protein